MSDMWIGDYLARELPLLAAGAVESGDPQLHARVCEQLGEIARWQPLQRPGWSLYLPGPEPPADFQDGNWLGTGLSLRAVTTTRRILGEHIPAPLRDELHALLKREIASVRDDFARHRTWFWNTPVSNQFVLPNTGVLLASIELGQRPRDADYEFAVANLLRTLATQGADGASHEGTHYAAFMNHELLAAALAAAEVGDRRLIDHPHLVNFGRWALHLLQPGGHLVNIFDGSDRKLEVEAPPGRMSTGRHLAECLYLAAVARQDPQIEWALSHVLPAARLSSEQWRWRQRATPAIQEPPPTFAAFDSSPLVAWRSDWTEDAHGVWIRGGSSRDSHDHGDRGHVNYIVAGREILIEAGSTEYGGSRFALDFKSSNAHNVLQFGPAKAEEGGQRLGSDAAIHVACLNAQGGDITVDATAAYAPETLKSWQRRVHWDAAALEIHDQVRLPPERPAICRFSFHLGREIEPRIEYSSDARTAALEWTDGRIQFSSDAPLTIQTRTAPHGLSWLQASQHTCVEVATREATTHWRLGTHLNAHDFISPITQEGPEK